MAIEMDKLTIKFTDTHEFILKCLLSSLLKCSSVHHPQALLPTLPSSSGISQMTNAKYCFDLFTKSAIFRVVPEVIIDICTAVDRHNTGSPIF